MCGINFIYDRKSRHSGSVITKMNDAIRHRGIDNSGACELKFNEQTIFLGANRLRIIDQDTLSDQPLISPDRKYALIFSGEIYNYQDLKYQLTQRGISFRTNSDTEVLMYYLAAFGTLGIRDLKGMFAFVFVDMNNGIMMAARDRHGMKPLFYSENEDTLLISSETRGIYSSGIIEKKIAEPAIREYLRYRYARYPSTLFHNIFQLSPGYLMSFDLSTQTRSEKSYLVPTNEKTFPDEGELLIQTEKKIVDSMKSHLQASKPAGLMLSGGVDSSLLLCLAIQHDLPLPYTFSVLNDSSEKSFGTLDFQYSEWLSKKFSLEDHERIKVGKEILHDFPGFVAGLDMPVGDPAFILTGILSKAASSRVGILLSGAGADEYFAGYNRHRAFYYYLKHYPRIIKLHRFYPLLRKLFGTGKTHPLRKKFRLINKFIYDIEDQPAVTYDNFISTENVIYPPEEIPLWPDPDSGDFIAECMLKALDRDRKDYLVNDILLMSDQVTMNHGIEIRSPYLDDDLVNYTRTLSPQLLMQHGNKWILKKILQKYGLSKIAGRTKEGFGMPFGQWLREKEFDYLREDLLFTGNKLFDFIDRHMTARMIDNHFEYKEDHSTTVFSLMVLSEWLKTV